MSGQKKTIDYSKPINCLLLYPPFESESFWNFRDTCTVMGAKYSTIPLGLLTVGAMLPSHWDVRLVDCNVEELQDSDLEWADMVFSGGMIAQQTSHVRLVKRIAQTDLIHIVGGPDPTSSPHVYDEADHLVLGEAEVTIPRFLEGIKQGKADHIYAAGEEKADVSKTPIARYDLLKITRYMYVGVQFARGCPFRCEFCDIIELFGRVPRVKGEDQILAELQTLYDLGYRGMVEFVDDNFIGNKIKVKAFLPKLKTWLVERNWPFEFSTEASINLADDTKLMKLMQEVNFATIFVGIESPDEETLALTQKKQNTRRSIPESIRAIYDHGMFVSAGYIVGLDGERSSVAKGIIDNIVATAIPMNMVGLLFALPNTQLSRRLLKEGRLEPGFEVAVEGDGDQCVAGLNFDTLRPRHEVLTDYKNVLEAVNNAEAYFSRVQETLLALDCSKKKLSLNLRYHIKDVKTLFRSIWAMGVKADFRKHFWKVGFTILSKNPRAFRYAMFLMAFYVHGGPFNKKVVSRIEDAIVEAKQNPPRVVERPVPAPAEAIVAAQ